MSYNKSIKDWNLRYRDAFAMVVDLMPTRGYKLFTFSGSGKTWSSGVELCYRKITLI